MQSLLDSNSRTDTPALIEAVEVSSVEAEARERRSAIGGIGRNAIPRSWLAVGTGR